jgi:hypothetical protein
MHVPCDVYGKTSIVTTGVYDPYEIEWFYPSGVEFPIPFSYDVWEVVTWVDNWLKRYYLISLPNDISACPIYVNSYYIPDYHTDVIKYITIPDTTLLLKGISYWFSFYYSRPMKALTPQMIYTNSLIMRSAQDWSITDELFMELAITDATRYQSYNMFYEFDKIQEELNKIDAQLQECHYLDNEPQIPKSTWTSILGLLGQPTDNIPQDEWDVLLKYSPRVNMSRLKHCVYRTCIEPPIQFILDVSSQESPMTYANDDFHPALRPMAFYRGQEPVSLLSELANGILLDGCFDFQYTFDLLKGVEVSNYAWSITGHPSKFRAFQTILDTSISAMKDLNISKLHITLDRGHIVVDITEGMNNVHRSVYSLVLHMLGPSGIILLDDYQRMPRI